jgi:ribonuclease PH
MSLRIDGREPGQMRPVTVTRDYQKPAEGSCLIELGDTRVLCAATVEDRVPGWRKGSGSGWITAEYAMLPRSTTTRTTRERRNDEPPRGIGGRTAEIQRLIGRSMRSVVDMSKMGERTIWLDCDVLQADGGTRTAAITGAFIALYDAFRRLVETKALDAVPVTEFVAATSVGIVGGVPMVDLCFEEDAQADVDMNVVMESSGKLIEVQGTAEKVPFSRKDLDELMDMAESSIAELVAIQKDVLGVE